MSALTIKSQDKSILTFDLDQQEVVLNYQNDIKASELGALNENGFCSTAQCYNCSQVQCTQVQCSSVQCSDCTTVDCTQVQCKNNQCNVTYDSNCNDCD